MPDQEYTKVEEIKRPLKKGEKFMVPCIVWREPVAERDWRMVHGNPIECPKERWLVTPVINHPHNDKENGQAEAHYHADYRFLKHRGDGEFPTVVNKHRKYVFGAHIRPEVNIRHVNEEGVPCGILQYFLLPVINEYFSGITGVGLISKSKLKHRCIHKGKCPHRGYDLSQTPAIDGVITCPLHGLKFDAATGDLLPPKSNP